MCAKWEKSLQIWKQSETPPSLCVGQLMLYNTIDCIKISGVFNGVRASG